VALHLPELRHGRLNFLFKVALHLPEPHNLYVNEAHYEALGQLGQEWLQRHPEAGSSWPSWLKASYSQPVRGQAGTVALVKKLCMLSTYGSLSLIKILSRRFSEKLTFSNQLMIVK